MDIHKIDQDAKRFDEKIKKLKGEALQRYLKGETLVVPRVDGKMIQIPIRRLDIPRFRYKEEDTGGVGQGEGEKGTVIGYGPKPQNQGQGRGRGGQGHGEGPGDHEMVEFSPEVLADLLGEQLQLPNLRELMGGGDTRKNRKYNRILPFGQRVSFKRSFLRALKREIATGEYSPDDPRVWIKREDKRYRMFKDEITNEDAVIIFALDYSGSMAGVIDFLKLVGFCADAWIQKHYPKVVRRYVHYDHSARETTEEDFYKVHAGGGTDMSTGLSLVKKILQEYPEDKYNAFLVHFTDGDCHGIEVTEEDIVRYKEWAQMYPEYYGDVELKVGNPLTDDLLPRCNGVFVCEAGAYYHEYNFSRMLQGLTGTSEGRGKLRFTSYDDMEIEQNPHARLVHTLKTWFGPI